jgi:hypothetical protein
MNRVAPILTIKPEALPEGLRELARVLGDTDALRLIGLHGGARVSVPKKAREDHPLRMALGAEAFDRLVDEYGGETIDLPKGDAYLRVLRHDQVRQCREQGLTVDETAEATGYSRRHVINIIGGTADGVDNLTMDLFEDAPKPQSYAGAANDPFGLGAPKCNNSDATQN